MKRFEDYGIIIPYGKRSGNVKMICPQCHESRTNKTDKSLSVNLDEGVWHCHYCGFSGTLKEADYQERRDSYAYRETRRKREYRKPDKKESSICKSVVEYFAKRGISEDTLIKAGITSGSEYMPQKEKEVNTIQFNYVLNGELVNVKYRTADKCFKLVSGAQLIPYNIDSIKGSKICYITEGEIDALSFIECGIQEVISVPNGANANLEYLDDFIESHFDDKEAIYIASDSDTKGKLLSDELIRRFGAEVCKIVEYGEGCKDANEHLVKYGKLSLLECILNAKDVKIEGIFELFDFEDSLDALFENGLQKGLTTGFPNMDEILSFESKRLCVITGIPSSGKSEMLDQIAESLNMRYGWKFAYFSPENFPLSYHASKLAEKIVGKSFSKNSMQYDEYSQVKKYMQDNFFFISPSSDFTITNILNKAKSLVRKKGIKGLVIDPYNRIESEQGRISETQYISNILDRLQNFAQQNDVLVFLMAHPTKMPKEADGRIAIPTLYDISGSAHFYNKADFGLIVHRHYKEGYTELRVSKVKFRHLGDSNKSCYFKYNINNGRYAPFYLDDPFKDIEYDNSNHLRIKEQINAEAIEQSSVLWDKENDDDFPF